LRYNGFNITPYIYFNAEQQIESKTFDQSIAAIEEIIRTANDINKGHEDRRTNSTELVLDTELLRRNHEVVGKAIQYNTNFTDRMVITAIVSTPYGLLVLHYSVQTSNRMNWISRNKKRIGTLSAHWLFNLGDRSSRMIVCFPS